MILDAGGLRFLAQRTRLSREIVRRTISRTAFVVPSIVLADYLHGPDVRPFLRLCTIFDHYPTTHVNAATLLRRRAGTGSVLDALVVVAAQGTTLLTDRPEDLSALAAHARQVAVVGVP